MPDPTTQSNYLQITSEHIALNWRLDFDFHIISGYVIHHLLVKEEHVEEVIFDTSDLTISDIEVAGQCAQFSIAAVREVMGAALHVKLPTGLKVGERIIVKISYKTSKSSGALQWLSKEHTHGKDFPYLYSQCQPIYARALVPIQDTTAAKFKYSATVVSKFPVLLSALRISPPVDGPAHDGKIVGEDFVTYTYDQPIPIPPYLIAIASGNVCYRTFPQYQDKQWKTGVWAEPGQLESAYWEFSEDTPRFLATAEALLTPYEYGVYDLLVLPPASLYGGMEHPCLTFLTPTVVTGDRTLVDVVIHEITHSWFGNGITHSEASHFWLNEGWTTYFERVVQEVLYSRAHRDFHYIIGAKPLHDSLMHYKDRTKYQRLVIDFDYGEDPDDAYSSVPYEKGANLLLYLERVLGGLDIFLPYMKDYAKTFLGKSITTHDWKSHLFDYYGRNGGEEKVKVLDGIDWNAWLYGEGLKLPVQMDYDLSMAKESYNLAKKWNGARSTDDVTALNFTEKDITGFDAYQIIVFLEHLQTFPQLPLQHVKRLGSLYRVAKTSNAELRFRFYEIALKDPASPSAKAFVTEVAKWIIGDDGTCIIKGRMKFCRPMFRAVTRVNQGIAVDAFKIAQERFHPIVRKMIEKDIGLTKQ
ncbi:hypothetical protein BDZ94DRAFT_1259460 [Collybia nuda]|uniref:Peptidase M1 leukotriene A4 hydrolase/aminopeptidase C-terminal domain-containing protein n=1 Tax=Collybia nuda TaxID=64659 RepID=A0A9P5Y7M7_9AGAR|nr:hypothetical protein BDZ94DRAFT_1259460 [Collybia nuda]